MSNAKGVTVVEPREPVFPSDRSMVDVQASRAVAEVQSAMTIAKKFPRDEKSAFVRVMTACSRKSLAEAAIYEYPRGGEKVRGPSIRLAEAVAQAWGNVATGIVELDRREGESLALAYCVDLETNYRKDITFTVPHVRDTKGGGKALTETRDIYELVANMGSRRLRNCIMAVIPGDIFDEAEAKCMETLTKDQAPRADRIRLMLSAFAEVGVTTDMIAKRFGCNTDALSDSQLVQLRGIYQSLKDGMGSIKDFFEVAPPEQSRTDRLNQETAARQAAASQAPKDAAPPVQPKPAVAPAPAAPGGFDSFGTSLFSAPKEESIESVQVRIAELKYALGYTDQEFLKHINDTFNKPPQSLNLAELKRLRDRYEASAQAKGLKV